ncbi:MAG: homogentisate phytyltransferase [Calditrichaeota bacterium]|nr:MAG: homogentisate phytyltransferase [Calditrichota bacterium]
MRYSRPHTVIGTTLSVLGVYAIAVREAPGGGVSWALPALTLLSCLGANIYIVGLNQIIDVPIDRINKPHLPVAAGVFSIPLAWGINLTALVVALAIAVSLGRYLLLTVGISLILGTLYSTPPIRLKRFHFWAAACIFTVRGLVVNLFLYLHFRHYLSGEAVLSPAIVSLTLFMVGLSLVIAWFKDLPDMEGDRSYRIMTLTLRVGPERVFRIGMAVLTVCYGGILIAAGMGIPGVNREVAVAGHGLALLGLWLRAARVDPVDKQATGRFYQFVWRLFFLEYLLFPLACWWG